MKNIFHSLQKKSLSKKIKGESLKIQWSLNDGSEKTKEDLTHCKQLNRLSGREKWVLEMRFGNSTKRK